MGCRGIRRRWDGGQGWIRSTRGLEEGTALDWPAGREVDSVVGWIIFRHLSKWKGWLQT